MPVLLSVLWGCIPEISTDCLDMTNSSSTYLSLVVGGLFGGIVSWWLYDRQKKISKKQDIAIQHMAELNESHDKILKKIERMERQHQETLDVILELNKKIEFASKTNETSSKNNSL